jgi:hypothetical protein
VASVSPHVFLMDLLLRDELKHLYSNLFSLVGLSIGVLILLIDRIILEFMLRATSVVEAQSMLLTVF